MKFQRVIEQVFYRPWLITPGGYAAVRKLVEARLVRGNGDESRNARLSRRTRGASSKYFPSDAAYPSLTRVRRQRRAAAAERPAADAASLRVKREIGRAHV